MVHHFIRYWAVSIAAYACVADAGQVSAHSFIENGNAGFVVSHIEYALSDDADQNGACPQGMTLSLQEIFALTPAGKRTAGETDAEYGARTEQGAWALAHTPDGQNVCMHPEAARPDPYFRTVVPSDIAVSGIDLDGKNSGSTDAGNASCSHSDFIGMNGETGVDNQFYRVVGCSRSYQSTGLSNSYAIEMLTGAWGILLQLRGVDDIYNDDEVEVGFYFNTDPIKLSPGRKPLPYASYIADPDPLFRGEARGRISNGVLTTDPVDVRFRHVVNSMTVQRPLRDARLQATISAEGTLEGYLAGYTPVEAMYDMAYGYRNSTTSTGELAPLKLRSGTATGAAFVLGHTCPGAYYAIHAHADGHPDPETGQCTSISTQYRIRAIPAFVIDTEQAATTGAVQ